jgi:hypothetical protein
MNEEKEFFYEWYSTIKRVKAGKEYSLYELYKRLKIIEIYLQKENREWYLENYTIEDLIDSLLENFFSKKDFKYNTALLYLADCDNINSLIFYTVKADDIKEAENYALERTKEKLNNIYESYF